MKIATVAPVVLIGCLFGHEAIANEWEDLVVTLGEETSGPITNGFFIYDCEYISPPYVVARKGTECFVNGHSVWTLDLHHLFEELPPLPQVNSLPSVPADLTPTSQVLCATCCRYYREVLSFYTAQGLSGTNLSEKVACEASRLPNVLHAYSAGSGAIAVDGPSGIESQRSIWSWNTPYQCVRRKVQQDYYRSGGLLETVKKKYDELVDELSSGEVWFGGPGLGTLGVSRDGCAHMFAVFLRLLDEGKTETEILAEKSNTEDPDFAVFTDVEISKLITHKDSWTEEFRRRLFGEYWQTYGVKPETEEERIERIFRDVSYYQRTTDDLLKRLDGMVYNITVRYHGDTNKFTEADIDEIDHSRLHYEEILAAKDAYWAALSEADKALMTVKLAQKKADEEAEKKNKALENARAAMEEQIEKYENKFKLAMSNDPKFATLSAQQFKAVVHSKAKAVYVILMAKECAWGVDFGLKEIPESIEDLIRATDAGIPVLIGGIDSAADDWGKTFRYVRDTKRIRGVIVTSSGPDMDFGTADDIVTTVDDL